jgi:hypothetical protein
MGFYTSTLVYFGRLLSQEAYDRIKDLIDPSWILNLKDNRGRYILSPPGCIISLASMDPIIEKYEIAQGYVKWDDILYVTKDREEKQKKIDILIDITNNELIVNHLLNYIRKASPENNISELVGKYIIEISNSSLDNFNTGHVKQNLRCI